jgi:hypothetical protein
MPRMDGMETLRRLRQNSDLPVIFLTSKDESNGLDHDTHCCCSPSFMAFGSPRCSHPVWTWPATQPRSFSHNGRIPRSDHPDRDLSPPFRDFRRTVGRLCGSKTAPRPRPIASRS